VGTRVRIRTASRPPVGGGLDVGCHSFPYCTPPIIRGRRSSTGCPRVAQKVTKPDLFLVSLNRIAHWRFSEVLVNPRGFLSHCALILRSAPTPQKNLWITFSAARTARHAISRAPFRCVSARFVCDSEFCCAFLRCTSIQRLTAGCPTMGAVAFSGARSSIAVRRLEGATCA